MDAEGSSLLSDAGQSDRGGGVALRRESRSSSVRSCCQDATPRRGGFFYIGQGGVKREQLLRRFAYLCGTERRRRRAATANVEHCDERAGGCQIEWRETVRREMEGVRDEL